MSVTSIKRGTEGPPAVQPMAQIALEGAKGWGQPPWLWLVAAHRGHCLSWSQDCVQVWWQEKEGEVRQRETLLRWWLQQGPRSLQKPHPEKLPG